jgi:hypothetical protein
LVKQCQQALDEHGLFNLEGLLLPEAVEQAVSNSADALQNHSFTHERQHNIYFLPAVDGLADDHPVLKQFKTVNHTVCSDQIRDNVLVELYEWPPFAEFLAAVMQKQKLYQMDDEISRLNVMGYGEDEALNWHFDRSEFTTTLLLQAPEQGGEFQYRTGLRSESDPNYDGIGEFLNGAQNDVITLPLKPGTLNVFRGKNTLHRVSPVKGSRQRVITVFSYYENPGVEFSVEEKLGFYGRINVL